MALLDAEPGRTTVSEILDELRTLPFLCDKRVVMIKNAGKFVSDNRSVLENYFDNPSDTGVLIITVGKWAGNTRLAKKLPSVGKLITTSQPRGRQLLQYLVDYVRQTHRKTLTGAAAQLLVEIGGEELPLLRNEVDKLAIFVEPEKSISPGHVEALVGHNRMFNIFEAIEAGTAGNTGQAANRLRKIFEEDKSAEYTAVGAFAYHFRKMFSAKAMLNKGNNPGFVAKRLGVWPSKKASFFSQIQKMSLEQIGGVLKRLGEIDYEIKTGRTKASIALEGLILTFSGT